MSIVTKEQNIYKDNFVTRLEARLNKSEKPKVRLHGCKQLKERSDKCRPD